MQNQVSKIEQLRQMLAQFPASTLQNVLASNSTIKNSGFGQYAIWAGGSKPLFKGTFDECKDYINQCKELHELD